MSVCVYACVCMCVHVCVHVCGCVCVTSVCMCGHRDRLFDRAPHPIKIYGEDERGKRGKH